MNLIFPMAGQGARFGYQFKPFLRFGEQSFIEAAMGPFREWLEAIRRVYFIFLEEQDRAYRVSEHLPEMFGDLPFTCVTLPEATKGPAETVSRAVGRASLKGPSVICDCDHSLGVGPLFSAIREAAEVDCILPVWPLEGQDLRSWSVASVAADRRVTGIAEKAAPSTPGDLFGVIGCYYFRDVADVAVAWSQNRDIYMSDVVRGLIDRRGRVEAVRLSDAVFFGDPQRLRDALEHTHD